MRIIPWNYKRYSISTAICRGKDLKDYTEKDVKNSKKTKSKTFSNDGNL